MDDGGIHDACLVPFEENSNGDARQHPVRVCVIDLGTNSFHTLIVDAYPDGSYQELDRIKEMVRLGERGLIHHRLNERAMERAIGALKRVSLLAEGWQVSEYLAFATSAVREAENGGLFIERVREETGIHVRTISGSLEAQLIYEGIRLAMDMRVPTLMMDIGGGSTEVIIGTSDEIILKTSLKLGAARMTQHFVTTDPVSRDEFRALREHYRLTLAPILDVARAAGVREIVGSSGTMENLAQAYMNRHGDPARSIFLQDFDAADFRAVTKEIMLSTRAERERMAGIDKKRVGQVVAGAMLVDVLLKDLPVERLRISQNALREGMVHYFIRENYERLEALSPYADVRRRSVNEVCSRFRWDEGHVRHVTTLALQLFDACRPLHGLGNPERELLEYASLLHDIGYYISRRSHHKHSLYLIRQADWRGFQPEEIDVMANVARYHRRSLPNESHWAYQRLSPENRLLVERLASFLRIANGLDRSHMQSVTQMRARLTSRQLEIVVETKGDPQLDVWGARRGADLFERVFGRQVRVRSAASEVVGTSEG